MQIRRPRPDCSGAFKGWSQLCRYYAILTIDPDFALWQYLELNTAVEITVNTILKSLVASMIGSYGDTKPGEQCALGGHSGQHGVHFAAAVYLSFTASIRSATETAPVSLLPSKRLGFCDMPVATTPDTADLNDSNIVDLAPAIRKRKLSDLAPNGQPGSHSTPIEGSPRKKARVYLTCQYSSPILRLPDELLGIIFTFLIYTISWDFWSDESCALDEIRPDVYPALYTLMHVCRLWRSIVMSTQTLWTELDMGKPLLTAEGLSRCGTCLSLDLCGSISQPGDVDLSAFYTRLRAYSPRFRAISLCEDSPHLIQGFMATLQEGAGSRVAKPAFGNLNYMHLCSNALVPPTVSIQAQFTVLHTLLLTDVNIDMNIPPPADAFPALQVVDIRFMPTVRSISSILSLLACAPNLQNLVLASVDPTLGLSPTEDFHQPILGQAPLQLPQLNILKLLNIEPELALALHTVFDLPNAKSVTFHYDNPAMLCELEMSLIDCPVLAHYFECHRRLFFGLTAVSSTSITQAKMVLFPIENHDDSLASPCLCPDFTCVKINDSGILEADEMDFALRVFEVWQRIHFISLSFQVLETFQGCLKDLALSLCGAEFLAFTDIIPGSKTLRELSKNILDWLSCDSPQSFHTRHLSVTFTPSKAVTNDADMVKRCCEVDWLALAEGLDRLQVIEFQGVPEEVQRDEEWTLSCGLLDALLAKRGGMIEVK